ncbi:hypothetical protein [Pseudomonas proteolytica]|uniref:hypothetical protein n=1 Tax=Pseudomonas proteolytica TaxID=219574 RepID=UPI0030EB4E1F
MSAYILWIWIYSYPNTTVTTAEYSSLERCEQAELQIKKEGTTRGYLCTQK